MTSRTSSKKSVTSRRGQTRRDFLKVAAGVGAALTAGPIRLVQADEWIPVEPGEEYDPDYIYVGVEWEWVDLDWEDVEPGEAYDASYDYEETEWEWEYGEFEPVGEDEGYEPAYDYFDEDGAAYEWDWEEVVDGEEYDPNYEYLYEDGTPVGEELWEDV